VALCASAALIVEATYPNFPAASRRWTMMLLPDQGMHSC